MSTLRRTRELLVRKRMMPLLRWSTAGGGSFNAVVLVALDAPRVRARTPVQMGKNGV
jgi:hypothetical protein